MAKRLRSIPPVIPHYPPDNDRGAYAPQLWYGDEAVNAADGPWYDAPPGSIYVQGGTTTGALYSKVADTGTAGDWQALAASGSSTGVYNVRDYGATGDGTTDDAAAINAAITAAHAGGGYVYLPAGTYSVGSTLNLIDSTTDDSGRNVLQGAGLGKTILKLAASADCDVISSTNFATLTGGTNAYGVFATIIRDLDIDGNKANNASGYGIRLYGRNIHIQNVHVHHCSQDGIYTEHNGVDDFSTYAGTLEGEFTNIKCSHNDGNGFTYKGPHDSLFDGLICFLNGGMGWQLFRSVWASRVNTYGNTGIGIVCDTNGGIRGSAIGGSNLSIEADADHCFITNLDCGEGNPCVNVKSAGHMLHGRIANILSGNAGLRLENASGVFDLRFENIAGYLIDAVSLEGGTMLRIATSEATGTLLTAGSGSLDGGVLSNAFVEITTSRATPHYFNVPVRAWSIAGYRHTFPEHTGTIAHTDYAQTWVGGQEHSDLRLTKYQENVSSSREVDVSQKSLVFLNNTANSNTITLSAPSSEDGKLLVLYANIAGGSLTLADSGACLLSAAWTPADTGTLTLIALGSYWVELARSANA